MEKLSLVIPKTAENLALPDMNLLFDYENDESRILYLEGSIGGEDDPMNDNSIGLIKRIMRYNRQDKLISPDERTPIKILIDSPGGDELGTIILANVILLSKTPVYTVNMCAAHSSAGLVFACGKRRYALPGSAVLVHSGSTYVGGTKEQADAMKKFFDKADKKFKEILFKVTKIDPKTYRQKAPKEWFLDDEECVKYGVADKIIDDLDEIL